MIMIYVDTHKWNLYQVKERIVVVFNKIEY